MTNPYYTHFRSVIGHGSSQYYAGIGNIYKTRSGYQGGSIGSAGFMRERFRRGYGWGSWFRRIIPLFKAMAETGVDVASGIAKDGLQGENVKNSALKHLKSGASNLVGKMPTVLRDIINKKGSGLSTKRKHNSRGGISREVNTKRARSDSQKLKAKFPALSLL